MATESARVVLFGKDGQIGQALQEALGGRCAVAALGRTDCDLASADQLAERLARLSCDWIINAAAYTAVDAAEDDAATAHQVNGVAPGLMAAAARRLGAGFVHYSTDYVFDGASARPYRESDVARPLSVYGRTKLAGETAVLGSAAPALVLRTAWVYAAGHRNFLTTILERARCQPGLAVARDQVGSPTSAALVAQTTVRLMGQIDAVGRERLQPSLYHLAAAGEVSRVDYARHIIACAERAGARLAVTAEAVAAVPSKALADRAPRPAFSALDTALLRRSFGVSLPAWQADVEALVGRLCAMAGA